jgi:hypothetical protein
MVPLPVAIYTAPYLQQAGAFALRKDIAKALAALDRGIAAGAPKEPLLLVRAQLQRSNGQSGDAILTYRELLRVNPKSVVGANELADTLADQSRSTRPPYGRRATSCKKMRCSKILRLSTR